MITSCSANSSELTRRNAATGHLPPAVAPGNANLSGGVLAQDPHLKRRRQRHRQPPKA